MFNRSIWSRDRTLSSATTPGQIEPGSDGNVRVLYISQSNSITGALSFDCLVSYPRHSSKVLTPLQIHSRKILQPRPTGLFDDEDQHFEYIGRVEYSDCIFTEGQDPSSNGCPGYDTKQSDGAVPVMLDLWGMWSTPSLPLLPGPSAYFLIL